MWCWKANTLKLITLQSEIDLFLVQNYFRLNDEFFLYRKNLQARGCYSGCCSWWHLRQRSTNGSEGVMKSDWKCGREKKVALRTYNELKVLGFAAEIAVPTSSFPKLVGDTARKNMIRSIWMVSVSSPLPTNIYNWNTYWQCNQYTISVCEVGGKWPFSLSSW